MARRSRVNPRRDKRMFSATSKRTKAINVSPVIMRGGVRL